MKEQNLFSSDNKRVTKIFTCKDFFYNNGIVNLYQFLQNKDFDITVSLNQNELTLEFDAQKEDEVYSKILNSFLKDHEIVYQTNNPRWYFDETKMDFIVDKKFDTKGGQKNDLRNGVYLYKKISELGLSREEVERLYLDFCERWKLKPEKELNGTLKVPNKNNEVIIAITLEQAIERFSKYFVSSDELFIDSKIHSFEDGQDYFHDMLKQPQTYKIDKWNALMYWFGGRVQRFYNYSYFIYPNSSNLEALNTFKKFLQIDDNRQEYRNDDGKVVTTSSNIDFFNVLRKDDIVNKYFYISKSAEEFEVKFFMYLFSVIYHIESEYESLQDEDLAVLFDDDTLENSKILFELLQYMSFVIYTDDGTFKTSLSEYTKAYRLIQFFMKLKEESLFKYLGHVFQVFSLSQSKDEVNLNLQHWCQKILSFSNVRKEYFVASFSILKNNSQGFGKELYAFEQSYLKNILGGSEMGIHENAKKIGDGVGFFCAELGDKDLLFKLRSVKNYKQLVSYFKDLKFSSLKNADKARFSNEFNESLENLLVNVEQNWEIARDYIAIYAIDKFKTVSFAKTK
ncbi:hypothetical protein [Sulfurospirillum cavolei]|uniref:hypothetical protein n=1 Tax=Sulfurospirillum cavolei TaxID=366522 RepID=UPI003FA2ABBC